MIGSGPLDWSGRVTTLRIRFPRFRSVAHRLWGGQAGFRRFCVRPSALAARTSRSFARVSFVRSPRPRGGHPRTASAPGANGSGERRRKRSTLPQITEDAVAADVRRGHPAPEGRPGCPGLLLKGGRAQAAYPPPRVRRRPVRGDRGLTEHLGTLCATEIDAGIGFSLSVLTRMPPRRTKSSPCSASNHTWLLSRARRRQTPQTCPVCNRLGFEETAVGENCYNALANGRSAQAYRFSHCSAPPPATNGCSFASQRSRRTAILTTSTVQDALPFSRIRRRDTGKTWPAFLPVGSQTIRHCDSVEKSGSQSASGRQPLRYLSASSRRCSASASGTRGSLSRVSGSQTSLSDR